MQNNSAAELILGGFTASKILPVISARHNFCGGFSADKYSAAAEGSTRRSK